MKLLPWMLAGASNAELWQSGKSKGDSGVGLDSAGIVKVPLNDPAKLFGMSKDILWISNNGAVSINSLDTTDGDDITHNLVFAPFWGQSDLKPSSGKVFYRVFDSSDPAAGEVGSVINAKESLKSFLLETALMVTFKNIVNPEDSTEKNTYQMAVVQGSVNGVLKNFVVFNYHSIQWFDPAGTQFGVFAALKETEQCGFTMKDLPDNLEEINKKKFFMEFGSDLKCDNERFRTECPEPQEGSNSGYEGMLRLADEEDQWIFYARHQCIPNFKIDKQTNFRTSTCEYDADYYDARWSSESPTCIDFNAVKEFKASVQATKIDGEDAQSAVANNPSRDDSTGVIENAIQQLGELSGLNNNQISSIKITDGDKPTSVNEASRAEDPEGPLIVEFEITVPLAVKDKVTDKDIKENLSNVLSEMPTIGDVTMDPDTITVVETTEECLTDCLGCKGVLPCNKIPPPIPYDACCGGCPADNPSSGKPYSTLVQACCVNGYEGEIYDPDRHVCCNGELMPIEEYNADKSQCEA